MGVMQRIKQLASKFRGHNPRNMANTTEQRTSNYESFSHEYFQQPRDLPIFGWWTIQQMQFEGELTRALEVRAAPMVGVEFAHREEDETERGFSWKPGAKCNNPAVKEYIDRQLDTLRANMHKMMTAQRDGWASGEITLKLNKETNQVDIDCFHPLDYTDCRLLIQNGKEVGIRVRRVKDVGEVDLDFPYAYFTNHKKPAGKRYGRSVLIGAYSPWMDKWGSGGGLDVRRLYMHKDAYGGMVLGYPGGETYDELQEKEVPNRDIARQIGEQTIAGGVIVKPSNKDAMGNDEWTVEWASTKSNPQHILQYPKDLDAEMRTGVGVTDGVIDNDNGGGLGDTRSIAMQAFYSTLDCWMVELLGDLCPQLIEPLVKLNFGEEVDFTVCHKPFAEQAMENQNATKEQNSNGFDMGGDGGNGMVGDAENPNGPPNGPNDNGPGGDDGPQNGPPRTPDGMIDATRMSAELVGQGVVSAAEMIKAARDAVRMGLSKTDCKSIEELKGNTPTEKQREAGNYAKAHIKWNGLCISIETPAGERRRPEWPALRNHYGYIKRTMGSDGDHVDVFVGPNMDANTVAIVDQCDEKGVFDEHKVILGVETIDQAKKTYLANYSKDWKVGPVSLMSVDDFKSWLKKGDTTKPSIRMSAEGERWITVGAKDGKKGWPVKISGDGKMLSGPFRGKTMADAFGDREPIDADAMNELYDDYTHFEQNYLDDQEDDDDGRAGETPSELDAPGLTRSYRRVVAYQADAWAMSEDDYKTIADEVWRDSVETFNEREDAKAYARRVLGVTAGTLGRLENKGFDVASTSGFDELGTEMTSIFPALNWSEDDDRSALLWELIREGKQKRWSRTSEEFHDAVDERINDMSKTYGMPSDWQTSTERPEEVIAMSLMMALRPGATKQKDGKTFILNRNHRWELHSRPQTKKRQNNLFERGKGDSLGQTSMFDDIDKADNDLFGKETASDAKKRSRDNRYFKSSKTELTELAGKGDEAAQAELDRRSAKRDAVGDGKRKVRVKTIRWILDEAEAGDADAIDRLKTVDNPNLSDKDRERIAAVLNSGSVADKIRNSAGQLRPQQAKLFQSMEKTPWQKTDELPTMLRDRKATSSQKASFNKNLLKALEKDGFIHKAWDNQGYPHYAPATVEVPEWLTQDSDDEVMTSLPDRESFVDPVKLSAFDESKHPRDGEGKFAVKEGKFSFRRMSDHESSGFDKLEDWLEYKANKVAEAEWESRDIPEHSVDDLSDWHTVDDVREELEGEYEFSGEWDEFNESFEGSILEYLDTVKDKFEIDQGDIDYHLYKLKGRFIETRYNELYDDTDSKLSDEFDGNAAEDTWTIGDEVDSMKFSTSEGDPYSVKRSKGDHACDIVFGKVVGDDLDFSITGTGNAFEVFRNVIDSLVAIHEEDPHDAMTFTAAESSRMRLYDRFVRKLSSKLEGYKAVAIEGKDGVRQYLIAESESDSWGLLNHKTEVLFG